MTMKIRMSWERVRKCHIRHLVVLACLLGSAILVLKTQPWSGDCDQKNLKRSHTVRKHCMDQLHTSLELTFGGEIDCPKIIQGEKNAVKQAILGKLLVKNKKSGVMENSYLNWTKDCNAYKVRRRFIYFPLSREEEDFPIAYSMVIHNNIEMFERLLRAIYTPQNIYCVHVDRKSPEIYQRAVRSIVSCFENVFVASKLERVVYATWSRVQADLNCMEDLLKSGVQWRYLINTCGTDFPIKTNAEIVRTLKVLDGRNSLESDRTTKRKKMRWQFHYTSNHFIVKTKTEKRPPPISSPMFAGSAYFIVSRRFVQYISVDPTVQQLMQWEKDTYSPDEHLWATLQRMPGVPGSTPHNAKYDLSDMNAIARLVKWKFMEGDVKKGAPYSPCTGVHLRNVCVFGAGDLKWMIRQPHLFANKFNPKTDNYAIQCLESYLRDKALSEMEL
ncbi:beta-1,3-galactosyl-O-glycosyl-glycoprotein beta-1,6-N-acetylglucosaminyltransferase 3-like [Ambystoma mexicanum]|uniref:beta-1,3-galactosyl-O-glycosyl-glycoprotein beta-1,6-N-acetylglucosaminyltransferase 3-like n=1 Tax=Ambystoma mexicanum TaxID=8296 RepID=UPI0037E87265